MSRRQFLIIIEKAKTNYAAYSPDLPGCVATGRTRREVERNMQEAIQIHVAGMLEDGLKIPKSISSVKFVSVTTPPSRRTSVARSVLPRKVIGRKNPRQGNSRMKRV